MKKWTALLLTLILSVSLCAAALADEPQYANTKAFLDSLDEVGLQYTLVGMLGEDETVRIGNKAGDINYDFVLFFSEDNETVYIRVWDLITFDPDNLNDVLRAVNNLNNAYSFTAWYVNEDENSINVRYDAIVREGASVPEIVLEALIRMNNIIEEGCETLTAYAK